MAGMFFDDSRPDRKKRSMRGVSRMPSLAASPIPEAKPYTLLTDADLRTDRTLVLDTESYINYFLAAFKCTTTGRALFFEDSPDAWLDRQKLAYVLNRFKLIGFNSINYDMPILQLAIKGARAEAINEASWQIINTGMRAYDVQREFNLPHFRANHVDLIEVAPIQASLKIYGGRIHCPRMQDLPFSPKLRLTQEQSIIVRDYCVNDLDVTHLLADHLAPQLALREILGEEYGMDLRSKSDAQIAEYVIGSELDKLHSFGWQKVKKATIEPGWQFFYKVPDFMAFKTPQLQAVLQVVRGAAFTVGNAGKADIPEAVESLRIELGGCVYRMGGGGLHSSEKAAAHVATATTLLIDRDVASYYPAIILNQGLYPSHLGPDFLKVYQSIVTRRLGAKLDKNKTMSEGLKITINGTFGKLGNFFSKLYAPDLLMQVTISGQLCLLMLIEAIELADIPVISANTDGVVIKCPVDRYKDLEVAVMMWEDLTGFVTEETRYRGLFCRDVNNYIAVKYKFDEAKQIWLDEIEGCKTKGVYSEKGSALNSVLSKNPECHIISEAIQAFLAHATPLAETIRRCKDVRKFVSVRTVKGGAEKNGVYLGKAIRWYYAQGERGTINYVLTGNTVPKSEGARPLMELPDCLPHDLDLDYYIAQANEGLYDVGYFKRPEVARLL